MLLIKSLKKHFEIDKIKFQNKHIEHISAENKE